MRIPLPTDINTRDGTLTKDAKMVNAFVDDVAVVKRCGVDNAVTVTVGTAQGIFPITINGAELVVVVAGDTVLAGTTNTPDNSFAPLTVNWFGISSCVEADVMAMYPTDDRGDTVYAGPSETPYTSVPATTNTYSIVGITPCGGMLRKCVTKTYSARSAPNEWKAYWTGGSVIGGGTAYAGDLNSVVILQSTNVGINQAFADGVYATCPASVGADIKYPPPISYGGGHWQVYYLLNGWNLQYMYGFSNPTSTQLTLYYIDVNEVWTYALI